MSTFVSILIITALSILIFYQGFSLVKFIYNKFSKPSIEKDDKKDEESKDEQK